MYDVFVWKYLAISLIAERPMNIVSFEEEFKLVR